MGKRKTRGKRGEDCKREKNEEAPDEKNNCEEKEQEEPQEEELGIAEKKLKTCNPKMIKDLIKEVMEKLYKHMESSQIKGFNHLGTTAITSRERKYEDVLFEQLAYHLRKHHGIGEDILKTVYGERWKPKDFNVYWKEARIAMSSQYRNTEISEVLEEIFVTYEVKEYATIAQKGDAILELLGKLKVLLKKTYQLSESKVTIETEMSKISISEQTKRWEEEGEIIAKEVFKDIKAMGVTMVDKVTNIDHRADRVVTDVVNHEIRVPRDDVNIFGGYEEVNNPEEIDEKILNVTKMLEDRVSQELNSEAEDRFTRTLLRKLNEIREIENDVDKKESFEKFIVSVFGELARITDPDVDEHMFLTMDSDELKETYKEALENALGHLNARQYDERPSKVTEVEVILERSYEKIKENTKDSGEGIPVSMGPGAKVSADNDGNDVDEENMISDEGWNITGKFKVLATKITNISIQYSEEIERENIEVRMFKVSVAKAHTEVSDVCENSGGIQEILPKIQERKARLWNLVDQPESVEKKQNTIDVIEEITDLDYKLCVLVELLINILNEVELVTQFSIKDALEISKRLTKSNNPNECYAAIAEVTTRDVVDCKILQQWKSLPKALKPETLQTIKRTVRALIRHKKYKVALKICLHLTRVKAMWKASVIMKVSVVRYAELKALEISLNIGQKVGFSRRTKDNLKQLYNTLQEFSGIEVAKRSEKRLNPNPVLIEDIFEALEARVAKERRGSQKRTPEGWNAYLEQENELIRVLSKSLRRNHPTKFMVIAIPTFKDYPKDCIEYAPVDGEERIDLYESQMGKWTVQVEIENNDVYDKPKDCENYETEADDEMLKECTGSGGMEDISKYPGLEEANEETRVLVIAEVVVKPRGKDDIRCNDYVNQLKPDSYGETLEVSGALFFEREISRKRAIFGADSLTQNSNLASLTVSGSKLQETGYSCGKGCKIGDRRCPSEQRNISEEDRRRERKYNVYTHGMCGREWFTRAKSHVNCHIAGEVFNSSANFNGDGVIVEQLAVVNSAKKLRHQIIRVVKLCVLLTEDLVDQLIVHLELLADRPLIVATHMPEHLGDDDVYGRSRLRSLHTRLADVMRTGSLYTPRYVANGAWVVANCSVGTNVTDKRTAVPAHRKLHMCKVCNVTFLSPVSLYMHLLYKERILGDINGTDEDHSKCKRFSICKCRLLKRLKVPEPQTEEEDFKAYEKEDVNKIGNRDFELYSRVQLSTYEFTDLALMDLYQFLDIFILLNQIGVHVHLPGGHFSDRHGLHIGKHWQRINIFGNLFKPVLVTTRGTEFNYLPGHIWKLEKHSSTRMTHRGELFEIAIREEAVELAETMNNSTSCERFASVGCTGMLAKPIFVHEEKIKLLEDRDEEELKILGCFFNLHQEILHQNILKQCLAIQDENLPEANLRRLQVLRILKQTYQDRAVANEVDMPALRKIPIGDNPFAKESLFDVCCGEIINAVPKHVATEAFTTNLNVLDGKEIFPNMVFKVSVPATSVEPKIKEIVNLIAKRIKFINEKGWKPIKSKPKGVENPKKKYDDFSVQPKIVKEDHEKKLAEIRKRMEKENAENIRAVRERWWCKKCKLARKHFYEHRNGCFAQMRSKQERKIAEAEIKDEIEENIKKRIAKEMEELKKEETKIDDSKIMDIEDETSENDEEAVVNEVNVQDIFDNQVIKSMDKEVTDSDIIQDKSVHVSMSRDVSEELGPVLYSRGDNKLAIITEERETSEDSDEDTFEMTMVGEDMDEETKLRMERRTTEQVESDEKIQDMVDSIVKTWKNNKSARQIRKEQRILAGKVYEQTKKMAKLGYSLVTLLRNTGGEIMEDDDSEGMNAIEQLSSDEEVEDIDEEVTEESPNDRLDNAVEAALEELPEAENDEVFETTEQNIATTSSEEPGQTPWCTGEIDEARGEYASCSREDCSQCYQF